MAFFILPYSARSHTSEVDNMELIYVDIGAESCQNMTFFFIEFQKYQETLCEQQLNIVELLMNMTET